MSGGYGLSQRQLYATSCWIHSLIHSWHNIVKFRNQVKISYWSQLPWYPVAALQIVWHAYCGYDSRRSASSTKLNKLVFAGWYINTGSGCRNHAGRDVPFDDLQGRMKNRSCGVQLVAVQSNELIGCSASGCTIFHLFWSRPLGFSNSEIALSILSPFSISPF